MIGGLRRGARGRTTRMPVRMGGDSAPTRMEQRVPALRGTAQWSTLRATVTLRSKSNTDSVFFLRAICIAKSESLMTAQTSKKRGFALGGPGAVRPNKGVPVFKTEAEERAFWETHESTAYVDWNHAEPVRLPDLKA